MVINEFATRTGDERACGDWIELRNDSANPVDISGWQIMWHSTTTNATASAHTVASGRVLAPGCHYLAGSYLYDEVAGAPPKDAKLDCSFSDNGGIALVRQDGSIVDQVGMSPNTIYKEGTPLPPFPFNPTFWSYPRHGFDTNNNAADFTSPGKATPQNSSSSCSIR